VIRTWHPGRSDFTHFVETLDYQHRSVSCQLQDLVSFGIFGEQSHQFLDQLVQIELSVREVFRTGKGEHDI